MLKTSKRLLFSYWLPVLLMVSVIATESTELFASKRTSGLVYPVLNWINRQITGHSIDQRLFDLLHALLRKMGHLTGYGVLCATWFRAIRATAREAAPCEYLEWSWFWTNGWARNALLLTVIIASADELHQVYLPSRTGTFTDVMIDSIGALIALAIAYLSSQWSFQRESSRRVLQLS